MHSTHLCNLQCSKSHTDIVWSLSSRSEFCPIRNELESFCKRTGQHNFSQTTAVTVSCHVEKCQTHLCPGLESFVHLIDSVLRLHHVRWMSPVERSERRRVERVVRSVGHVDSVSRLQQRQSFSIHTARLQDLQTPRDSSSHWLHAERRDESSRRRRERRAEERRAGGGGLGSHWIAAGCTGTLLRVSQASLTTPPKPNGLYVNVCVRWLSN